MANDFEREISIDINSLDREWLKQPVMYMKYAEQLAKANAESKRAKEAVELLWAELDSITRTDAATDNKKITEAYVDSQIKQSPTYKKAQEEYRQAIYNADVLSAVVSSLDHRKKALENLVTLYVGQYFSAPSNRKKDDAINDAASAQRASLNTKLQSKEQ